MDIIWLILGLVFNDFTAYGHETVSRGRVFEIDYENDRFLKDGEHFQYVSGSLHYFRLPRVLWRDRLRKLRAAGLNAVSTYVEWSQHEPQKGVFDFSGDKDIEHFVRLAEQEGLLVILRPGPYICAERDLGGYPAWLLHENPNMVLRTNDSSHTEFVHKWLTVLFPRIQPLLYGNGGPVIMVQVENEYGSYFACDRGYMLWLRDLFRSYVGKNAVLFTTDGYSSGFLKCGPIPGVFITVDFGSHTSVTDAFKPLQRIQPHGPLVNSEFYPGWLDHWGENKSQERTSDIVKTSRDLLAINASFNYYVFFGGTNFGFTSGVNSPPFLPQITSYDYDAPITEAGDLTEKYFAIKQVLSEFMPTVNISVRNSTKMNYGTVHLEYKGSLFDSGLGIAYPESIYPKTFEDLAQYSGFILYETQLPADFMDFGVLVANGVHDRSIIFIDKVPVGIFSRSDQIYSMLISGKGKQTLGLLVENQGHINYGNMFDLKGLVENVTLNGANLTNWKHTGYPLQDVSDVLNMTPASDSATQMPGLFTGQFQLPPGLDIAHDTFVNMEGWTKGQLYVNGFNLGRFWPLKAPQVTLYLPGVYLHPYPKTNSITVVELEKEHASRTVQLISDPIWVKTL